MYVITGRIRRTYAPREDDPRAEPLAHDVLRDRGEEPVGEVAVREGGGPDRHEEREQGGEYHDDQGQEHGPRERLARVAHVGGCCAYVNV